MNVAVVESLPEGERRRSERRGRRPVRLGAYGVLADGLVIDLTVLDLSYEGCAIECQFELTEGERLKLYVIRRGAIDCVVRWVGEGKAGLAFESAMERPKQHWPRRYQRVELNAEVRMRRLGKATYSVRVSDLSPYGCKVELVERPEMDEHVLVKFPGLQALESEVCWIDGPWAGLRFVQPMHAAVFELLVETMSD